MQVWSCSKHRQNQANTLFFGSCLRLEQNELPVVLNRPPSATRRQQRRDRRVDPAQNRVYPVPVEQFAPLRTAVTDGQILVADLFSVVVMTAVEEHFLTRVISKQQIARHLIRREDAVRGEPVKPL